MIYHNLYAASKKRHTTAALIGVGHFGTAVLIQSLQHPRLEVVAIADQNLDSIHAAAEKAGLTRDRLAVCSQPEEAAQAIAAGRLVITTDPLLLMTLPVDTIVEATGHPEGGAVHALAAITSGKHVVMVNKETDSCVGPMLRRLADEAGVVYTPVDGDQHGALMALIEWARDTGLDIVCAGKSRDAEFVYDRAAGTVTVFDDGGITIPKTVTARLSPEECRLMETQAAPAAALAERRRLLSALDPRGGFDLCEMVIAANATGLQPDVPLLHDPICRPAEIPSVLCPTTDGGILGGAGRVDVITTLRETGEAGLGGGVFLVVSCKNAYSQMILNTKGCLHNPAGNAALVFRPYHLCGVEAPTTLLCAGLLGIATGSLRYRQDYDIVQEARVPLAAGDVMGNDHDPRLLTRMVPAAPVTGSNPVPAHMLSGLRLRRDVAPGTVITCDMVERPETASVLWQLRARQDAL
ncbi:MAG: flagellar biosynthesis protein FlgA [Planctomycetes bacterium]|nr:flagellar biosynthesis protein FlgA [Planctomycetota bacterium]